MRTLSLVQPNLCGADAARWQKFLADRGVFNARIDGVFGHLSDQATRAYQSRLSSTPNGMVDQSTLAQAASDGFAGLGAPGVDASAACTTAASQLAAAGIQFVMRYYCASSSKALKRAEALALSQTGLQIGVVYQDFGDQIQYFSADLGRQNATAALAQASAVGQPAGSAIYFSADFNPDADQINGPLTDHFRAIADVFAASSTAYRVGVYGSGLMCSMMLAAGLAQCTWLSQSPGFTDWSTFWPQANLVQSFPSDSVASVSVDFNIAQTPDFGQFTVS